MTIFAVMAREPRPELETAIVDAFPNGRHFRLSDLTWLVSSHGTAQEVSEAIGVRKGGLNGVVVMPGTGAYYGVASSSVWDWMRAALEEGASG